VSYGNRAWDRQSTPHASDTARRGNLLRPEPGGTYDVFVSHQHTEAEAAEAIGAKLADRVGLTVWLDKWVLVPGEPWQQKVAKGLEQARTCAVLVGRNEPRGWFREEIGLALNRQARDREFRVIPVILPDGDQGLMNDFLELRTWVDFRDGLEDAHAFHVLVCGVRGVPPGRRSKAPLTRGEEVESARVRLSIIHDFREQGLIDPVVALEFQRQLLDGLLRTERQ